MIRSPQWRTSRQPLTTGTPPVPEVCRVVELQGCKPEYHASSYCSACADPESAGCERQIRHLCAAGHSRNPYGVSYEYSVNFLWYKLGHEAPKYCQEYLGYGGDGDAKQEAKCAIIDAIVHQCEKERHSRPCPYGHTGAAEGAPRLPCPAAIRPAAAAKRTRAKPLGMPTQMYTCISLRTNARGAEQYFSL